MEGANQNPFLNVREAGAFLRLKKRTLDNMRWMGTGPSFRKYGGRIGFAAGFINNELFVVRVSGSSSLNFDLKQIEIQPFLSFNIFGGSGGDIIKIDNPASPGNQTRAKIYTSDGVDKIEFDAGSATVNTGKQHDEVRIKFAWTAEGDLGEVVTQALFQYINGFYNSRRRHSAIGGVSPITFERKTA